MFSGVTLLANISKRQTRFLNTGVVSRVAKNSDGKSEKGESERMKKFHDKLKLHSGGGPEMRLDDLILVETDPKSGEALADSEKDPTKWGDWQHGGRVSDF